MHLDQHRLTRLLQGLLSQEAATEALGHIATCDQCALRLEALRRIHADFEESWEEFLSWLPGSRAAGADAFAFRGGPMLSFAVRVLLDGKERIAAVGSKLAEFLCDSPEAGSLRLNLSYSGIGDAEDTLLQNRQRLEAAESLGRADYLEARQALRELSRLSSDAAAAGAAEGGTPNGIPLEVVADATSPALSVLLQVSSLPPQTREAIVLRASAVLLNENGVEIRRAPFHPVEGADYLLADFDPMEDGNWIIGVDLGETE